MTNRPLQQFSVNIMLAGSRLAKMKKYTPLCVPAIKFIGKKWLSKKFQIHLKKYDFCEYVKFTAMLVKI